PIVTPIVILLIATLHIRIVTLILLIRTRPIQTPTLTVTLMQVVTSTRHMLIATRIILTLFMWISRMKITLTMMMSHIRIATVTWIHTVISVIILILVTLILGSLISMIMMICRHTAMWLMVTRRILIRVHQTLILTPTRIVIPTWRIRI